MRLSTKGRFAVTAMIDVALREHLGPVSLAGISVRHQMSLSYLEQLFSRLRAEGLVESTRGPGGGYTLGRPAAAISVADILGAVEGAEATDASRGDEACWTTQELWTSLHSKMQEHLQSISLASLAERQRTREHVPEVRASVRRGVFVQPKPAPLKVTAPNSVFALGAMLARG